MIIISSQSENNKIFIIPIYDTLKEGFINFDEIIIPFSNFSKTKNTKYIYNGIEKTPFKERHPVFQELLLKEFEKKS